MYSEECSAASSEYSAPEYTFCHPENGYIE